MPCVPLQTVPPLWHRHSVQEEGQTGTAELHAEFLDPLPHEPAGDDPSPEDVSQLIPPLRRLVDLQPTQGRVAERRDVAAHQEP